MENELVQRYAETNELYLIRMMKKCPFCERVINKYVQKIDCIPTLWEIGLLTFDEAMAQILDYTNQCKKYVSENEYK